MTSRRPCSPAPGLLEAYAQRFDVLFSSLAQRRGFRDYLQGLLLPRDRNKTLTGWQVPSRSSVPSIVRSNGCSGSCRIGLGLPGRRGTGREEAAAARRAGDGPGIPGARCRPSARRRRWRLAPGSVCG
jgi:hypothetical protein